ncbi:hypothetical protein M378DRAFT_11783 [Amanita muscaria Koide BX008]|uniref:SMODS and SLOG-associating 2TM effector domain-containing protein n=1 Tax=Amanita muscaria (strain Koide BX008) TaxID=946122 RepID=A0A0C2X467_AMAMK|nr:hypothetical protein M378DRAFT_11783 [Amanita muscaria Koide BX008]
MSSEPSNSGVRPEQDPPQSAPQQTADQAEQDPQAAQTTQRSSGTILLPPRSSSGPSASLVPPTLVESPQEQNRTQTFPVAPRNVSVVTLDAVTSDHHGTSPQDAHAGPSQVSYENGNGNGRVHLGNGVLYSNRHPSLNRPQTAPGVPGARPRTGDSTLRPRTGDSMMRSTTLDWVVPIEERSVIRHTVEERIAPTLEHAIRERDKLKMRARTAKWSINIAAAMQIFLGSMTTGLSAIGLDGKHFGVATTVLGILATLTGAFLARVRATDEPETSLIRAHDLDSFIRDCEAFRLDCGLDTGDRYDQRVEEFRRRFEMLLGNMRAEAMKTGQRPATESVQQDKVKQMQKQLPV